MLWSLLNDHSRYSPRLIYIQAGYESFLWSIEQEEPEESLFALVVGCSTMCGPLCSLTSDYLPATRLLEVGRIQSVANMSVCGVLQNELQVLAHLAEEHLWSVEIDKLSKTTPTWRSRSSILNSSRDEQAHLV